MGFDWFKAQAWKLATAGTATVALGLGVALVVEKIEHGKTEQARELLHAQIYDVGTGLIARNTQLATNVQQLQTTIDAQNVASQVRADRDAAALAEANKSLTAAQAATAKANARVAELMRPLVGKDFCTRVVEMDERILKDLSK